MTYLRFGIRNLLWALDPSEYLVTRSKLLAVLASALTAVLVAASVEGREPVARQLRIANSQTTPALAYVRSTSPMGTKSSWVGPIEIATGGASPIVLGSSSDRYDVAFRQPDGNFIYLPDLALNLLIDNFKQIDQPYLISAAYGNWDARGFRRLSRDELIAEVFTTEHSAVLVGRWK